MGLSLQEAETPSKATKKISSEARNIWHFHTVPSHETSWRARFNSCADFATDPPLLWVKERKKKENGISEVSK
jgi:hypothetical protein